MRAAVLLLVISAASCGPPGRSRPWRAYSASTPVFRLLWDADDRDLVVGARNALLKLSQDLSLTQRLDTGPTEDNPQCAPSPLRCIFPRSPTDNDVKVMLSFSEHIMLVCGSVNQGMCRMYSVNNLTYRNFLVGKPNDLASYVAGRGDVVAFFAKVEDENVLYAAVSYDGRPEQLEGHSISSKTLHSVDDPADKSRKMLEFGYYYETDRSVSAVSVHPQYRKHVRYLHGFEHEGYSYFISVQRLGEDSYGTRLGRVCHGDHRFFSYSEVTLRCLRESALVYNLATAAYLGDISKTLRNARDLQSEEKILYVTFGRSDVAGTPQFRYGTAVCMFPMSQLDAAFVNATRDCFAGPFEGKRIESILGPETKCDRKPLKDKDDLKAAVCDPGSNHYVEGREPVPGGVRAHLPKEIATSLAVTLQKDSTVAFIGTANGSLVKFVLEKNLDKGLLYKVPLDPDANAQPFEVQSSNTFDENHENLYMLTGNKVVKFPAGSCLPHPDCRSCLGSKDPLGCGWCGDRCSTLSECGKDNFKENQCPPFIYKVWPLTGHVNGGTLLTLEGDNLGSQHSEPSSHVNITVGDANCTVVSWEYERIVCRTGQSESGPSSGAVVLSVVDTSYDFSLDVRGSTVSEDNFTFVAPRLFGAFPWHGAMSGGTNVTLVGHNLDIGSNQTVSLAGVPCKIKSNNGSHIECTSGGHSKGHRVSVTGSVIVWIDDNGVGPTRSPEVQELDFRDSYDYRADPVVQNVEPRATTWSGGTKLLVAGTHLDSVYNPRMVVTVTHSVSGNQHVIVQDCSPGHPPDEQLVCRTPSLRGVPEAEGEPRALAPVRTHVSFLMDGVVGARRFPHDYPDRSEVLYYPDPVFHPFHKNLTRVRTDTMELVIEGMHLNLALRPEDVLVKVNSTLKCNVTRLTSDLLTCILPTHLNSSMVYNAQTPIPIEVVAGNQHFYLGGVTLVNPPEGLTAGAVAGIALGCSLLLAFLFLVLYKRGVLNRCPFLKTVSRTRYVAAYTADHGRNDYGDHPSSSREETGLCQADGPSGPRVSDETMHLLTVDNILVSREYLSLQNEIGQGHFGRVYLGELELPGSESPRGVAVKTLHSCRYQDIESAESFLQEGLMMKDFRHKNVLTLIGVCFEDTGFPMVILPFMKHGDLRSYIQDEKNEPTIKLLIEFGIQIAEGMKYLSELKFVHRDLAARNCMLDEDLTVKVADFGLSRDIYERDYYSSDNKKSKLPVKWMAPESLEKGTYSTKSDVWSFGVVMWELMTRGVTPYPEVGNWEILNFIKAGRRMLQPSYCPDMLYNLMQRCWHDDARKRPTFAELGNGIRAVIKKMEDKHRKVGLNVTYVNVPSGNDDQNG